MSSHRGPLVSVVVPCYNQGRFLDDALASVLSQDYPSIEVVVVDDGSRDETPDVIARYPRVRALRQTNRGLAHARNAGLAASRGTSLVFLDADDRLLPGAIAHGVAALEADPANGFVFGHHRRIDAAGRPLRTPVEPCDTPDGYAALLRMNFISMPAQVMFRRDALLRVGGFDTRNHAAADYEAYLGIARTSPIRCHHADVAEYRVHDANMTRNTALMLRATLAALHAQRPFVRAQRRYCAAYAEGVAFTRTYYASRVADDMLRRLASRDWRGALAVLAVILRHYPGRMAGRLARPALRLAASARVLNP